MRKPYSKQQLADAIDGARSWGQVNIRLGRAPEAAPTNLKKLASEYEIDVEHLGAQNRRTYTDEQLRDAIATCKTWAEIAVKLGKNPRSGAFRGVMRRTAERLELDVSHLERRPARKSGSDGTRTREGSEPQPD